MEWKLNGVEFFFHHLLHREKVVVRVDEVELAVLPADEVELAVLPVEEVEAEVREVELKKYYTKNINKNAAAKQRNTIKDFIFMIIYNNNIE